jgi:hypothetical protein
MKRIAAEKRKQKAEKKAKEEAEKKKELKQVFGYDINDKELEELALKLNPHIKSFIEANTPKIESGSNQKINIEIDYGEFKKVVAKNADGTNPDEDLIFRRCFKPYYKGGKQTNRGRDEAMIEAIFRVLQANAPKLVKKVIREDIV